ncbi:MAG TPA: nuclear transport factor 2 family protein [Pyrinomonadaceae bacterium]|nr:nuclear transport factor 2 family protein [Pyrinomonadaceae bacterium]
MKTRIFSILVLICVSSVVQAQTKPVPAPSPKPTAPAAPAAPQSDAQAVLAAFDKLVDGIEHANVNEVMSVYWNNPQLNLFNYNGTVTKGWDQVRKNRESSYPQIKDVKLEVRDKAVHMLGRDGAIVTCQWKQSQTYKGAPETVTGRMTLVFKRVGTAWKAIHLHSSPDNPDPSRIPASEQQPDATPASTPSPKPSPSPTPPAARP